jgi:hypothetical protein
LQIFFVVFSDLGDLLSKLPHALPECRAIHPQNIRSVTVRVL